MLSCQSACGPGESFTLESSEAFPCCLPECPGPCPQCPFWFCRQTWKNLTSLSDPNVTSTMEKKHKWEKIGAFVSPQVRLTMNSIFRVPRVHARNSHFPPVCFHFKQKCTNDGQLGFTLKMASIVSKRQVGGAEEMAVILPSFNKQR